MSMAMDEKSLSKLREYLASRNFTDKYFQTSQLINKFDSVADIKQNLSVLKVLYEDFLYEYPFNHTYWNKYVSFYIRLQQYDSALQVYEEAVSLNSTSPDLWNNYINFVAQHYSTNIDKIIEVYEKAIKNIAFDVNSHVIWDSYLSFLEPRDTSKLNSLFLRILNYPVSGPNEIYQRYEKFINGLDHLQYQQLLEQYTDFPLPSDAHVNKTALTQAYANKIRESASTNPLADSERKLHDLLEKTEFDGEDLDASKDESLKEYLSKQEKILSYEKLIYLYKKCLVVKCKYGEFWVKILHLLDRDPNNQLLVNEYFRIYAKHFNVIENKELVSFFQADLKEKDGDIEGCREIYKSLEQKRIFEAYLRHLYMEIRQKKFQNVVDIFVSLSQSVQDNDQIAFVVQEMGDIFNKLGEVDKATEIIKRFNDKKGEYSKIFYISWINFLKNCKKSWDEIEGVFKLAFEKIKDAADKEYLWKTYVYTARSYCSDINALREVERRYALREEPTGQNLENGINSKRKYDSSGDANDDDIEGIRKQVKTN
jgi:hypothetical protein